MQNKTLQENRYNNNRGKEDREEKGKTGRLKRRWLYMLYMHDYTLRELHSDGETPLFGSISLASLIHIYPIFAMVSRVAG